MSLMKGWETRESLEGKGRKEKMNKGHRIGLHIRRGGGSCSRMLWSLWISFTMYIHVVIRSAFIVKSINGGTVDPVSRI